jgi:DNA-binding XRE family transcriptional regulator
MPNISSILKEEISRVARKVLRPEIEALRRSAASQRSQLTELKRRLLDLEKLIARQGKGMGPPAVKADKSPEAAQRFSAKGFKTNRKRLGVSAADLGKLLGVTGQTIYNWEDGKSKPPAKQMAASAALRRLGKRQLATLLEERVQQEG